MNTLIQTFESLADSILASGSALLLVLVSIVGILVGFRALKSQFQDSADSTTPQYRNDQEYWSQCGASVGDKQWDAAGNTHVYNGKRWVNRGKA